MQFRDAHPEVPIIDVHHQEFRKTPLIALRRIYDFIGMEFPPALQQEMPGYLAERAKRPFGKHDYALENFGVSREQALAAFGAYIARYDVSIEPQT
jgi:hypothetical protein